MDYTAFSVEELADIYINQQEERESIEGYVMSLSDYQQGYFNHLIQAQEPLPMLSFEGHNFSKKRDGVFIWSDELSLDGLKWDFVQRKEDLIANNPEADLQLFVEKQIKKAKERVENYMQDYENGVSVEEEDKNSRYISTFKSFVDYLESESAKILTIDTTHPVAGSINESTTGTLASKANYRLPSQNPKAILDHKRIEERRELAMGYIDFMAGYNLKGQKIMPDIDYLRLREYTTKLICEDKLPDNIKPIYSTKLPAGYIRYTYYLIHLILYTKKPQKVYFIDFLYDVFPTVFNEENVVRETTRTKFSVAPQYYDKDIEDIKSGKFGK